MLYISKLKVHFMGGGTLGGAPGIARRHLGFFFSVRHAKRFGSRMDQMRSRIETSHMVARRSITR